MPETHKPRVLIIAGPNGAGQGGHNIPENTIRRRFSQGIDNFKTIYSPIVDGWALYDSSGDIPALLDWAE